MFKRIKEIRELNDYTQRTLAKTLKISKTNYNYFENGERIIPLNHLNNFCNLFNVSIDYVLELSNYNVTSKYNYQIDKKLIGSRLKELRKSHNKTQQYIAKLCNTSQSTISSYESGKTLILTAFILEICKEFNISADYLTGRSNIMKINL